MQTIELFSCTKSFSKVAKRRGHSTFTIDNDPCLKPDQVIDILLLKAKDLPKVDILWASPPCTAFSTASMGRHWGGGFRAYIPISETAVIGQKMVKKTIRIIQQTKPRWWFIENPRCVLRKLPFMLRLQKKLGVVRHTVTYCQ